MNRKLRRMLQRKEQKEQTIRMTPAELHELKTKMSGRSVGYAWEQLLPVFLLYLVDHYGCKEKGVLRFMSWFNAMAEWIDEDPDRLNEVIADFEEKSGVEIKW